MEIIRLKELIKILSVSKATIWRWRKSGSFPEPICLGNRVIGWRRETIENWIEYQEAGGGK